MPSPVTVLAALPQLFGHSACSRNGSCKMWATHKSLAPFRLESWRRFSLCSFLAFLFKVIDVRCSGFMKTYTEWNNCKPDRCTAGASQLYLLSQCQIWQMRHNMFWLSKKKTQISEAYYAWPVFEQTTNERVPSIFIQQMLYTYIYIIHSIFKTIFTMHNASESIEPMQKRVQCLVIIADLWHS